MSHYILYFLFTLFFKLYALPDPDPETIQPFRVNQSPPATIPAFPEQSNAVGCPLNLPEESFHAIKSACGQLNRGRCCPVLASWLYAAYSATALGSGGGGGRVMDHTLSYDPPLLPDDSETCVDDLGKALRNRGIELAKPNATCDAVYCYCGIRLHPLSCPDAFSVNQKGEMVGDESVVRLERNCLSNSTNVDGFPGLGGCSNCLNSLHMLSKKNKDKGSNSSKSDEKRTTKMHKKDCELMGLTWLLQKNRTAYIHTVSSVLRAMMLSKEGSHPISCTLSSDGMPLAVDSNQVSKGSYSMDSISFLLTLTLMVCSMILLSILVPHM